MGKHAEAPVYEKYNEDGETDHEKCPRCGSFLAQHDNRASCGKCGYTRHE